ncbi:MAG: SDR family NAD(P)-dependent oxidoreductase [Candidatus Hodarchaeota archaeon]
MITGAGRGIGRSVAIAYAKEGANVGLTSRTLDQLNEVKAEIEKLGNGVKVSVKAADITKYEEVEAAFKQFGEELGKLNGVVANAGTTWKAPTHELDPEKFAFTINVNLLGVFHTFRAAYPFLDMEDKKDPARFLITGSETYPNLPMPMQVAYTASKFGVVGLMNAMSMEYGGKPITFNTILPSMTDTKLLRGRKAGDGNKPPNVLNPWDLDDYYIFFMTKDARRLSDQLAVVLDFEVLKKIIAEAPAEKKVDWDTFKVYLEEKDASLNARIKKLKKLAQFLLSR